MTLPLDAHRALKERMTLDELVSVSILDPVHRFDAKFELRRRVDRQLEHFDLNPATIFAVMDTHGAIISGSVALAVLFPDDDSFFGNDIDFYLAEGRVAPFVEELQANTDYNIVKTAPPTPNAAIVDDVEHGYPFIIAKSITWLRNGLGKSVNIIEALEDDPFKMIPTFYTTLVMNAITHKGVVCLYPELTIARVGVMKQMGLREERMQSNISKYSDRGFNISDAWLSLPVQSAIGSHVCGQARCCPWTSRDTRSENSMLWMCFNEHVGTSPLCVVPAMSWTHHRVYDLADTLSEAGTSMAVCVPSVGRSPLQNSQHPP